jgi:hypothetical protein
LYETIAELKGFYVKTAQIISSRQDLFPSQYTEALSVFADNLDPMPASLARAIVKQELLHADETFDDIFTEFDDEVSQFRHSEQPFVNGTNIKMNSVVCSHSVPHLSHRCIELSSQKSMEAVKLP